MKLLHSEYTFQIEFCEGMVQKLVVEAPEVMSDFIFDLKRQLEGKDGKWVLSHEGEIWKIHDRCELIMSIFDLEINQRKMLNVLHEELTAEINDTELYAAWRELLSRLEGVLNEAIDRTGFEIAYRELELKALFKALELKFRENEGDYVEYLLEYLQLMSEVRNINIFVFVNISSFLNLEQIRYLYEQAFYKKYYLLFWDVQDFCVDKNVENTLIIDKDYCIIEANMK